MKKKLMLIGIICFIASITGCGTIENSNKYAKEESAKVEDDGELECTDFSSMYYTMGALHRQTLKFDENKKIHEIVMTGAYMCKSTELGANFCDALLPRLELYNEVDGTYVWILERTFQKETETTVEEFSALSYKEDKSDVEMLTITSTTKYNDSSKIDLDEKVAELTEQGYTCDEE